MAAGVSGPAGPPAAALLEARGLTVCYPGVRALDAVDFSLRRGEIHGLMGGNGAGKSTLLKVLTGALCPDSGLILLEGAPVRPRSPAEAMRLGISAVHQEIALIPELTVAENLVLGREPSRLGWIDRRRARHRAAEALSRLGLELDVTQPLRALPIALRQMVAIARALDVSAGVLVLDEPTSSLDRAESQRLFALLRDLRGRGLGIVFVTHFVDQVYEVADRITVLRNGRLVGTYDASALERLELVARMLGRPAPPPQEDRERRAPAGPRDAVPERVFLSARGLGRRRALAPIDLELGRGEVLGVAGLLGSGRSELARLLFGLDRADSGTVHIEGRVAHPTSPRRAIGLGLGYLPEDRREQGLVPELSVQENIVLALQARRGWWRPLPRRRRREVAGALVAALGIEPPDLDRPVAALSGGNQQKAVLARALATDPACLLLDEPTRGIDVGAKAQIERLVTAFRDRGVAVLFISAELEEVARAASRVIVLRDRRKVAETGSVPAGDLMRAIAEGGVP